MCNLNILHAAVINPVKILNFQKNCKNFLDLKLYYLHFASSSNEIKC